MKAIQLTDEQKAELAPEFLAVRMAFGAQRPGMLVAQVLESGSLHVGFLNHDQANTLIATMGKPLAHISQLPGGLV
jgi:hypothetical protein